MRRYVTYDANTDTMTPAATAPDYSTPNTSAPAGNQAAGVPTPRKAPAEGLSKAQTWAAPTMVGDPHLSGDDPKMFPGVLTRGRRKNSLRNLSQADDAAKAPGNDSSRADAK